MKKIHRNDITGERGIYLIGRIVLEMGCLWYPTGGVEAGIDGTIELRDATTGGVSNLIIQVQSKATAGPFTAETDSSFEYLCKERDLDYWLGGNTPIILVVSRPMSDEAYWVALKDYFRDPLVRKGRKVRFDKVKDRFDTGARAALIDIATPNTGGIYFNPPPRHETLWSNLLAVASFQERLYLADTEFRRARDLWAWFRGRDYDPGNEWVLRNGRILSFHDLSEEPWCGICGRGTIEDFATAEWANSDDPDRQREFVWLLNETLRAKMRPDLRFDRDGEYLYVAPSADLTERTFAYRNLANNAERTIFKGYADKRRQGQMAYYRHSAFMWRFLRFDGAWQLEITPTYHFTIDGWQTHPSMGSLLTNIKRLEHNQSVLGQVLMWAGYLGKPPDLLTPAYPFLTFGRLHSFPLDAGVDDARWLGRDGRQQEARDRQGRDDMARYGATLFET